MSASEVLETFGTRRLLAFTAALVLFLALHLVRMPLLLMARLLEACMARVDGWVTASVSTPSTPDPGGDIRQDDNVHQGRGSQPHHHNSTHRAGSVAGEVVG